MALRISKIPLLHQIYFYLLLTDIITTVISWLNLNSWCIIATLLVVLVDGNPFLKIKRAFVNPYFLAYFFFFLFLLISLFWADDILPAWKVIESKTTLIAVPFLLVAGPLRGKEDYKKVLSAYCIILFLAAAFCLLYASWRFINTGDSSVFFYHDLVDVLAQNAIIFSVFMLVGLLFLFSSPLHLPSMPVRRARMARWSLAVFFTGFIILLSSKLMLIALGIVLFIYAVKKFSVKKNRGLLAGVCVVFVLLVTALLVTNNPIKKRYQEIFTENLEIISRPTYTRDMAFNGLTLRLIIWRFGLEILNEQKAWLAGVGPGDSQDLLNKKYIEANMYTGDNGRDRGFLGYNLHNQFLEQCVQTGLIGLGLLLCAFTLVFRAANRTSRTDAWLSVLIIMAACLTESLLELQHGLFLFSFVPFMLLIYRRK